MCLKVCEEGRSYYNIHTGYKKYFRNDRYVYYFDSGDAIPVHADDQTHQNVYLTCVQFLYVKYTPIKQKRGEVGLLVLKQQPELLHRPVSQ